MFVLTGLAAICAQLLKLRDPMKPRIRCAWAEFGVGSWGETVRTGNYVNVHNVLSTSSMRGQDSSENDMISSQNATYRCLSMG